MLNQAIAVANGKGGVGKTALVANIGMVAASSGWRVLLVDLDPQGNLGSDLGYRQRDRSDDGAGLSRAVQFGEPLVPVAGVRENLDVVPAGAATSELSAVLARRRGGGEAASGALARALAPLADTYDLVLIDCPPGDDVLGELGLVSARGLLVPVRLDGGSLDGLELMSRRFATVRASGLNPHLELLGIALFDVATNATTLRAQVEEELRRDFPDGIRVFASAVRHSQRAAFDMRREGLTALEYETAASDDRAQRLRLLRSSPEALRRHGPAKATAAEGLAEDYVSLANEVLSVFVASESPDLVEVTG